MSLISRDLFGSGIRNARNLFRYSATSLDLNKLTKRYGGKINFSRIIPLPLLESCMEQPGRNGREMGSCLVAGYSRRRREGLGRFQVTKRVGCNLGQMRLTEAAEFKWDKERLKKRQKHLCPASNR